MSDLSTVRAEFLEVNDREILLELLVGQRAQNGAINRHETTLFGDLARQEQGLKVQVQAHQLDIARARTTLRAIIGFIGVIGIGNIAAWITLGR